jgi:hypothetical protein
MSAVLSMELYHKYNMCSVPIHKNHEVQVVHVTYNGREGKVVLV